MESLSQERKEPLVCDPCRIKKIKCGRERPCCAHCQRLGQACSWTGYGKKPSQTTTLSQSLELLISRFDSLESLVLEVKQSVERLQEQKLSTSFAANSPPQHMTPYETQANGRSVDPITLHSLALDAQRLILNSLCESDEQANRFAATSANEKLETLLKCTVFNKDVNEDALPQMPPVDLVQSMITPYFDQVSPAMPLWTQNGFLKMMDKAACSVETADWATKVCANNLVLMTLVAKGRRQRLKTRSNALDVVSGEERSPMELAFLNTFLQNAKRALPRIELLQSPSLLNLQALLSLCLVAQQHWSLETMSSLFAQATYLAQCLRLDCISTYTDNSSPHEDLIESSNALRCLCVIGSSIHWVSGYQSFFSMKVPSDVAMTVSESIKVPATDKMLEMRRKAQLSLTKLEERAFAALYAVQTSGQMCTSLHHEKEGFYEELDRWSIQYIRARNTAPISPSDSLLAVASIADAELKIRYHTMRLLLAWPLQRNRRRYSSVLLDSRSCLKLVMEVRDTHPNLRDQECLARVFVSYPPLAFYVLTSHVIREGDRGSTGVMNHNEDDLQLLQSYTEFVEQIFSLAEDGTYARQLVTFQRSLVEFAADRKHRFHLQATEPQSLVPTRQGISIGRMRIGKDYNEYMLNVALETMPFDAFVAPESLVNPSQMDFNQLVEISPFILTPECLNTDDENASYGVSYDVFSDLQ